MAHDQLYLTVLLHNQHVCL